MLYVNNKYSLVYTITIWASLNVTETTCARTNEGGYNASASDGVVVSHRHRGHLHETSRLIAKVEEKTGQYSQRRRSFPTFHPRQE